MIDICTVVFEQELDILRLQAASIEKYCSQIGIRNIYILLNDVDTVAQKIDPAWWGEMAPHVLVIPRTTFSAPWIENGWVTQQLYKLLTASLSYNTYTMVLDAKTIFVRELDTHALITSNGQLTVGQLPVYSVFKPAKDIVDQLFDIDLQTQVGPGGVPFFFNNDLVRCMIAEVTLKTQQSFAEWFQKQGTLTEFMLYSAYIQYKFGSFDPLITTENTLGQVVNLCHTEVARFDSKLTEMKQPNTLTVSIHRNAWGELDQEQRNQYRMLLIDRGITPAYKLA
jgi:hypothetical protein